MAARWNLLNRCPCRCVYCALWRTPSEEPDIESVERGLKEMSSLGVARISFSGGEPLLRDDIGRIISCAAGLGMSPTMNSSGYGLEDRVGDLEGLDLLKISIDGPREVHDRVRGLAGAFDNAMKAAEIGKRRVKKISFATTITKYNVDRMAEILDISRRFNTVTAFQPVKALNRGVRNVERLAPSQEAMREAIDFLLREKKAGNRHIRNSLPELEHIRHWPHYPQLFCSAGRTFVMINPDGTVLPCDRIDYDQPLPNMSRHGISEALRLLPEVRCDGCGFCGSLGLNMLYSLNPRLILDVLRLVN